MKEIWNQYSYAILLICLSFGLAFLLAEKSPTTINDEDYLSITIEEGDSLWELSQTFAQEHKLSSKQFINWVKKTNDINEEILPGDSIIIPVKKDTIMVASTNNGDDE